MIDELSEELRTATRPQEVVRAAGAWLGAALADQDFRWVPEKDMLRRERGRRIEEIEVENAHGNRAGRKLFAELEMRILDLELGAWRLARYPEQAWRKGNFLARSPVAWVAGGAAGRPDLCDPAGRVDVLTAVVAAIKDKALPWFDVMSDPESMARTAPMFAMRDNPDCVIEFLASHGRTDLVGVVVDQALTRSPTFRPGYDRGYQLAVDGQRADPWKSDEVLGWLTATHGEPGYLPPADAVPPPVPLVFGGPVNVTEPLRKPDGTRARVALTGRIKGVSGDWFTATVSRFGGQPVDSVSVRTDLLVVGERPNAKVVAKATALGVPRLPGDGFAGLWYAHDAGNGDRMARILGPALAEKPAAAGG